MSNHTPEPWAFHGDYVTRTGVEAESLKCQGYQSGYYICTLATPRGRGQIRKANGQLIARSPNLLKVAKLTSRLLNTIECTSPGFSDNGVLHRRLLLNLEMVDAEIAKAEGENA